jgi:hypothetical protein
MKLTRNVITNIMGAVVSVYGSVELAVGNMTIEKFMALAPVSLLGFATGSKDEEIRRLKELLTPEDRAAAKGAGTLLLNQFANRFGLKVMVNDLVPSDSDNRGSVAGGSTIHSSAATPDLERFGSTAGRGNAALNADTLESIANDVDNYGRRGDRPDPVAWIAPPESIEPNSDRAKSAAWYAADVARGGSMAPSEFAEWSQSGDEDPQSEAW